MTSPSHPSTMRAWTIARKGPFQEVLIQHSSLAAPPPPTNHELLIKIAYTSINHADLSSVDLLPSFLIPQNSILGIDLSGTIVAVGPEVSKQDSKNPYPAFKVGDKVFGHNSVANILKGWGTLAEYVNVDARTAKLRVVPKGLSMAEAGGLGVAGFTAAEAVDRLKIRGGERVLVNGVSGGCGTVLVQALKGLGVKQVVGICSGKNEELVKGLGTDKVVDYQLHSPVHEFLEKEYGSDPFDIVIDTLGNQLLYTHSAAYLKESGSFMNFGASTHSIWLTLFYIISNFFWPRILGGVPRKYLWFQQNAKPHQQDLLVSLIEEGKLKGVVDKVYDFEDAVQAYEYVESKRARGKVIVKVEKEE